MDWPNERYIRIYIRDTLTWKRMRFEGQTVFMHVARKLDRAGRLPLDGMEPAEALSMLTDVPEDFAEAGFARLLDLGVFVLHSGDLLAPNWVEAQEAKKSDAQRKRESRERQKVGQDVTPGHTESHPVTKRDERSQDKTECDQGSRDDAETGQGVTPGHTASRSVTPSLAEPSLAEPNPPSGDAVLSFAIAWRELTGRSEFADFASGSGPPTGTEQQWLFDVRKVCGGQVSEFRARVGARLTEDTNGFLRKQTLHHWLSGPLQAPAEPPKASASPAAPYHAPLPPLPAAGDAVTYSDYMAQRSGEQSS